MTIGRRQLAVGARSLGEAECRRPATIRPLTEDGLLHRNYALSASPLSHAESPCGLAFLRYPDFSCGVQRKRTTAVAGFLMGGLPLGRLGFSIPAIMWLQIILDKGAAGVFNVATLNQEPTMTKETSRRILQAIAECDRFIEKEEPRAADLRPADMAQHVEFCKAHKAKLIGMLAK